MSAHDHDLPGCMVLAVVLFVCAWGGAQACSAPGSVGVQETGDDPRHVTAPTSPSVRRETPRPAKALAPPELRKGRSSVLPTSLDLPRPARLAPVSDRVKVCSGFMYRDGRKLFAFREGRVGASDVSGDHSQLGQARHVARRRVDPLQQACEDVDCKGQIHAPGSST